MQATTFLFISSGEIILILFVFIMLFGADKLPEVARGLGKGMRMIKDATNDIKHEITKTAEKNGLDSSLLDDVKNGVNINLLDNVKKDINASVFDNVQDTITEVRDEVEDFSGSVKRKL